MGGTKRVRRFVATAVFAILVAASTAVATGSVVTAAGLGVRSAATPHLSASPEPGSGSSGRQGPVVNAPHGMVPHVGKGQKPTIQGASGASTNPQCPSCNPPLLFTGGAPVMGGISGIPGHVTITPVYWNPGGFSYTATYKAIVNGYLADVALASQKSTNVFSTDTQYFQSVPSGSPNVHIQYVVQAGAEIDDTAAYPAPGGLTGCGLVAGYTQCVTDAALQTELHAKLVGLGKPINDSNLYLVFFPSMVETCFNPGPPSGTNPCSSNAYCAYHSATTPATSSSTIYGNEPFPMAGCFDPYWGPQAPNGDSFADGQVSLVSHEANESITDWTGTWFDSAGFENGDECAYVYGVPIGSTGVPTDPNATGTMYNQSVGNGKYYTQDEFSNEDFALGLGDVNSTVPIFGGVLVAGCVQHDELPTASFTGPASVAAGATAAFNGSASSDPDNVAALTFSWNWGDGTANGSGATPSHVFATEGGFTVSLTVTDVDGWSGTTQNPITVTPRYVAGAVGTDNELWVLHSTSPSWTPDGGVLLGAPAVVAIPQISGPASPLYIATASDHSLWVRNDVHGWQSLSSSVSCLDNPAGAVIAGTLYLACEGSDNALWHVETPAPSGTNLPGSVSGWKWLGGILFAGPAVANVAGTPTYFVIGTGNQVFSRGISSGYVGQPWSCVSHPAVAAIGSTAYFGCHGVDGSLWYSTNTGAGWSGAQSLGGALVDGVGVAATSTGPIFFAEGTGGTVWHRTISTGWASDGATVKLGIGACAL